ncbi:MAG TPA: hypothetical protein PLD20_27180 [Blastocatellia bacterium]|nr:hypothetical protein [Blastocatellia bacterium]HMV84731.1 hypothetical protein [Blastocatellia bacterium]HMX24821.1 hypothetical protein [Blastocatellia bacterium]HMY71466.1 hypothetical protein [Blastocatellia bacterium]HMZ21646.1 hypothetical protein [Blastocatellia bacterium]
MQGKTALPVSIDDEDLAHQRRRMELSIKFVGNKENAALFRGQWILLDGGRVVASGNSPKEVVTQTGGQQSLNFVLHFFPDRDPYEEYWGGI